MLMNILSHLIESGSLEFYSLNELMHMVSEASEFSGVASVFLCVWPHRDREPATRLRSGLASQSVGHEDHGEGDEDRGSGPIPGESRLPLVNRKVDGRRKRLRDLGDVAG